MESEEVKNSFPDIAPPKTVTKGKFEGIFTVLWRRLSEKGESKNLSSYFDNSDCSDCNGERLNELSRGVTVENKRLPELVVLSLEELYQWILEVEKSLKDNNKSLVESYLLDLKTKIKRILNVGLGYLTLDRQANTLSGGETQRIRLASSLDSSMLGLMYVMDEPTIGLHPKDTMGIVNELKKLRDQGNTVLLIEHDVDVMNEADYIIDIGPEAGKHGGQVVARGTLSDLMNDENSVTGNYLKIEQKYKDSFRSSKGFIEVKNANVHNLKNINVKFPMNCLTSVTGVSGSGKSTLVFDILEKQNSKNDNNIVLGTENFNKIITVEQSPLTRMKRSNVATYSGIYDEIRKIFGNLEQSKIKGLTNKHFSFNSKGGRCENCEGLGYVVSNMLFFKDIEVTCTVCGGNQFNEDVLSVKFNEYSIKDILRMPIDEAVDIFKDYSKIVNKLELLKEVGLGYLELGQTLTTLSGGEGQRLKLAKELIDNKGKNNLYLIDEPTTGLHPIDVDNFMKLLNKIVDFGNTVIVVEHNTQVIRNSDYIIDLGPEGGINGGQVLAFGTPAEVMENENSVTGQFL